MMKYSKDFENKILKQAEKEMMALNHPYVGSEHLILALLKNKDIIDICDEYNLTYNLFREELVSIIGIANLESKTILHTPLLKNIIKDSKSDAKENNSGVVTPYHLFINILECGDGIGVRILISLGIDLEGIYRELKCNVNCSLKELNKYGKDLSDNETKLIDRDNELNDIVEILLRKNKNNPLLIGESGVGKTAIIEGLANNIKLGKYKRLNGYKIVSLDISLLISGSKYRGDFEERLNNVIKESIESKKTILFIDEIHTIINAGGSEGAIDAANILKPYLSKGELKIIGATTKDEYKKYLSRDKALLRRFDVVNINEPDLNMTRHIIYGVKDNYKKYHNINISNKVIDMIIDYSNKFIIDKKNPDKTLDVLDSVCSYVKNKNNKVIKLSDIEYVISRKINRKLKYNKEDILKRLYLKIYGQDDVLDNILDIINSSNNFKSILLLGGIGVGKSISIKEISNELSMNYICIDMSEYSNLYSINNLYNGDNSLYSRLNNNSIILFDNIEKCNKSILNIIIKIIDEKKIKDKKLNNSIVFLSATNMVRYGIGFNNDINSISYNNKDILNLVDYVITFNNINVESINKYIEYNNIKNFDINKCDYINYGFRGVKISLNSNNVIN